MSGAERQRRYRASHPGCDRRYKARRRAIARAGAAQRAAVAAAAAATLATPQTATPTPATPATPQPPAPPAPAGLRFTQAPTVPPHQAIAA